MGVVQKVSIALTGELAAEIEAAIATGDYATTSEVVRDALRSWKRERTMRSELVSDLRIAWNDGITSGDFAPLDSEAIKAEGRKRQSRAQ